MNWRTEVKAHFEDRVRTALGLELLRFAPWNSQGDNSEIENVMNGTQVLFTYSAVGEGVSYSRDFDSQSNELLPIQVTLYIQFNDYTEEAQNKAYNYAYQIKRHLVGTQCQSTEGGLVSVIYEQEDINRDAVYTYMMTFAMEVRERILKAPRKPTKATLEIDPEIIVKKLEIK